MAVDPVSPNIIYAAGRDNLAWDQNQSLGAALSSDDYGLTWAPITFTHPISAVGDIVVHPTDHLTLYVTAGKWTMDMSPGPGKGVFRSRDGGQTWEQISDDMGNVPAFSLAIHPDQPQVIYATAWLTSEQKVTVFKSVDGGDSWVATGLLASMEGMDPGVVPSLVVDPLSPQTLYVGAADGLFRSTNAGATWTRAAGQLGEVSVTALASASDQERTITYVGTVGGVTGGTNAETGHETASTNLDYIPGGIYQYTTLPNLEVARIYLPVILRRQ
jgi:photosystem II stability/assembly factor-like uncharacterized protein